MDSTNTQQIVEQDTRHLPGDVVLVAVLVVVVQVLVFLHQLHLLAGEESTPGPVSAAGVLPGEVEGELEPAHVPHQLHRLEGERQVP